MGYFVFQLLVSGIYGNQALTGLGLDYVNLDQLREKLQNQGFEVLHLSEQY